MKVAKVMSEAIGKSAPERDFLPFPAREGEAAVLIRVNRLLNLERNKLPFAGAVCFGLMMHET